MEPAEEILFCTPEPRLGVRAHANGAQQVAFMLGDADGVLHLATVGLKEDLSAGLSWAREWGRKFFVELCLTRDPNLIGEPSQSLLESALTSVPPMLGAEYVNEVVLRRIWEQMRTLVSRASGGGLEGWLRERSPLWHLVGRVTFHLAENKRNEERPFAFLATYTDQLSAAGRVQHIPLGRALQAYVDQQNQTLLEALLRPVRAAAQKSGLVREMLETRRLFQALAWTPTEAYQFLQAIPVLDQSGVIVKVPDWWKGRRPSRPMVAVKVEAGKTGGVGLAAMLSFNAAVTLDGVTLSDAEWRQIRSSPAGLVNLRGQWVEVDCGQLERVLEHWTHVQAAHEAGSLSFHEGMRWLAGIPATAAGGSLTPDLESARQWTQVVAGEALQELLAQLREPVDVESIPGLKATLRPYQKRGVAWLNFVSKLGLGGCLADDMGLGKTLQVIGLLCLRKEESLGRRAPAIIIVPASLIGNWMAEFRQFAPHLRVLPAHPAAVSRETLEALNADPGAALGDYDILVTTYGMLQRSERLTEAEWSLAVLDEAQAIKNPATAQSRSVKKLKAHSRLALTGTPIENRLSDLWSLFDFLNPGLLGKGSEFAQLTKLWSSQPEGFAPLRRLISPYLLRRMKTDRRIISDLPDKTEVQTRCALSKKQAILYAKLVEQLAADLANTDLNPNERRGLVLGYLIKFKQVCNHPSHWSGDGRYAATESGKFVRLSEIAVELAQRQERCLVFTQFREMTEPLAAHLATVFGQPGLILHGGTPVNQRSKLVEQFQRPDGPPFFVLSVKAGGTGLTLTAASQVIHFDRWWNPAVENQATDRAFRIGQKRNVLVHKFVCPGTIEEKVDALIAQKGALAEELLSGQAGAEKQLTEMSNAELVEFVRLDVNAAAL